MSEGDTGLTGKQIELLRHIQGAIDAGVPIPSYANLAKLLGLKSRSNINRLLDGLEQRGWVRLSKGLARGTTLLKRLPPERAERFYREVPTTILDPTTETEGLSLHLRLNAGVALVLKPDGTYELTGTYAEMIEADNPIVRAFGHALQDAYDAGYEDREGLHDMPGEDR